MENENIIEIEQLFDGSDDLDAAATVCPCGGPMLCCCCIQL